MAPVHQREKSRFIEKIQKPVKISLIRSIRGLSDMSLYSYSLRIYSATTIGTRILPDDAGFSRIFSEKIRENPFESAEIRVPTELG